MSTFLTQGGYSNRPGSASTLKVNSKPAESDLQSALQHAPFVKPVDKSKKDVADLSFSDFQPKRFALNYEPPMISKFFMRYITVYIVLEYLVPSTGKLYHHKMKLRQLKAETSTEEVLEYLRKRHPLYFVANKISTEQIHDLVNRLKFKIKQLHGISTKPDSSKKENNGASLAMSKPVTTASATNATAATSSLLGPLPSIGNNTFKSGSQLPSISNNDKKTTSIFPPPAKKQELIEDEEEEEYEDQYEEEEDEDDDGDFDANELLNLTDYQNKRGKAIVTAESKPAMLAASKPLNISKDNDFEEDDDGWGDDWGAPKKEDFTNFDYKNTNLNKLSND